MSPRPYQLAALLVSGRLCLVVGGGPEAEGRARGLVEAGAALRVFSPELTPGLRELAASGAVAWVARPPDEADLAGAFLVVNTARDEALAARLFALTRGRALLATLDRPELSDIAFVAVAAAGALRIGVSTGGASPYLARRLREDLEAIVSSPKTARLVAWLSRRRAAIKAQEPDPARRAAALRALAAGLTLRGELVYPRAFLDEDPEP